MRLHPVFVAALTALAIACWFGVRAQQTNPPAPPAAVPAVPVDSAELTAIATTISQRSEHLKPMFDEVHPSDWIAKGAPSAYISQWNSLIEQNQAIQTDMAAIVQRPETMQDAPLQQVLTSLFRVHRFDSDLDGLLDALRRYQNPALADLIQSVAAGDRSGVERLQQYGIDLAAAKDRQLEVVDQEAQRCRASLSAQPVNRPSAAGKTSRTTK